MLRRHLCAALLTLAAGCSSDADGGPAAPGPDADGDAAADTAGGVDAGATDTGFVSCYDPLLALESGAPGPLRVGFRTWELTYALPEVGDRTITLNVWYPTEATDGPAGEYLGFLTDDLVLRDAPPAAPPAGDCGYPVHAHSHGSQGFGGTSAFLMRHFASHGWLAIAPDHTGNTIKDNQEPRPLSHYYARPMDMARALDALDALPADDPLAGLAATDRVLLSGHSFGSFTVWASAGATFDGAAISAACADGSLGGGDCPEAQIAVFEAGLRDPRVVAAVPMAGTLRRTFLGATGHTSVAIPLLALSGDADDPTEQQARFDSVAGVDLTWVELAGGCHQSFALGDCATLDVPTGFDIVDTYVMAFARKHVLGDAGATTAGILDGSVTVDPAATLQVR